WPRHHHLTGATAAVAHVEAACEARGIRSRRLPVATAFHTAVVAASVEPFGQFLNEVTVRAPTVEVYANAEAAPYKTEPDIIRTTLAQQIEHPVRFVEQIEAMYAAGVRTFVEVGPNSVLTQLVGRILGERPHRAVPLDRKGVSGARQLHLGLGQLWTAGVEMDLGVLWEGVDPEENPHTQVRPRMAMPLHGANWNKPYPPPGGAAALPAPNPEVEPEVVVHEVIQEVMREVPVEVPATSHRPAGDRINRSTSQHPQQGRTPDMGHQDNNNTPGGPGYRNGGGAPSAHSGPARPSPSSPHGSMAQQHPSSTIERRTWDTPPPGVSAPYGGGVIDRPPMEYWGQDPWWAVVQENQRQTAMAHTTWQQAMTQAHMAYLHTAEMALQGAMLARGVPSAVSHEGWSHRHHPSTPSQMQLQSSAPGHRAPVWPQHTPTPTVSMGGWPSGGHGWAAPMSHESHHGYNPGHGWAPQANGAPTTNGVGVHHTAATSAAGPPEPSNGYQTYPSARPMDAHPEPVHAQQPHPWGHAETPSVGVGHPSAPSPTPGLPHTEPLSTTGVVSNQAPGPSPNSGAAVPPRPSNGSLRPTPPAPDAAAAVDLKGLLLEVVSEKTGYPAEMLTMEMALESDLGIDSIKRVEILSAMTERAPGLPEVDTSQMAALETLGQIVAYMRSAGGPEGNGFAATSEMISGVAATSQTQEATLSR
ncbi:MAG: acyltransferase domain-containing protein, partial [Myxococcota bacterium]